MTNTVIVKVPMKLCIVDLKNHAWSLHQEYIETLREYHFGKFPNVTLHVDIRHLLTKNIGNQLFILMESLVVLKRG